MRQGFHSAASSKGRKVLIQNYAPIFKQLFLLGFFLLCSKRLSAQSALNHPWLISSAQNTELHVTKTKLKRYVIKKRWIKAVNTIIALRRMGAKIDVDLV